MNTPNQSPRQPLRAPAGDQAQPSSPAEAAAKEAAEKEAAEAAAKEPAKPARRRRGPPADGAPEKRVMMVLTTSKLSDANGVRLRRGRLVSVPERRIEGLVNQGRIRNASADEVEVLKRRHGFADLG